MNHPATSAEPDIDDSSLLGPAGRVALRNGSMAWVRPWVAHPQDSRQVGFEVAVIVAGHEMVIAGARYAIASDGCSADFAVAVMHGWQGQGLGCVLVEALFRAARRDGVRRLVAEFRSCDQRMANLMERCGFTLLACDPDSQLTRAERGIPDYAGSCLAASGWDRPAREQPGWRQ